MTRQATQLRTRSLTQEQTDRIVAIECNAMASGDMHTRRLCTLALTYGCADSISELLDIIA